MTKYIKCWLCAEGWAWMENHIGQCDHCGEVLEEWVEEDG